MRVWHRLVEWCLRGHHLAAPLAPGTPCCVPGCDAPAEEQWWPGVCALREAGVRLEWVPVCAEHDLDLNESYVRLLFGSQHDEHLAAYRERRLGA